VKQITNNVDDQNDQHDVIYYAKEL